MGIFSVTQLSKDPWIWGIQDFLSDEECQYLIKLAEGKLQPSPLYKEESSESGYNPDIRSSTNTFLKLHQDDIVKTIEDRLDKLTNIPTRHGEGLQLLNYQVGQLYKAHYDFFRPSTNAVDGYLKQYGQRITTVCMYLNTVEEGGCTYFPEIGLEIWPIKGHALMWHSVNPVTNALEWKTLHEAQPVIKGEKWMATKWYRNLPFQDRLG